MITHTTALGALVRDLMILKQNSKIEAMPFQNAVQVMVVIFVVLYKYKSIFYTPGMILRTLKLNDYRAWIYLLIFTGLVAVLAVCFSTLHNRVFDTSPLGFVFTGNYEVFGGLGLKITGVVLLLANVMLFDYVLISEELVEKNNHVPAFLLGLYFSYCLQQNPLHPQLLAQLLLTFSYKLFISTYRVERAAPRIFDGAFCLSCAVILYPPYWMFFALGFICLSVLRPFNAREFSLVIIGLGLPYLFYYTVLFLCNQSLQKPEEDIFNSFNRPAMPVYYKGSFLINFTSCLVVLFTGIFFLSKRTASKMKTQKALVIFLWTLVPCLAAVFITKSLYAFTGQMAIMPLTLFAGIYFGSAKRRILAEILLLLLLGVVIFSLMQFAEVEPIKI